MWRYIDGEKVEQMGNTIEGLFRFKEAGWKYFIDMR